MIIEIVISVVVIGFAVYTLFGSLKKKASGDCGCGNCSSNKKKA